MGCVNSKSIITTRSTSIRQDLGNPSHEASVPVDELLTSNSVKNNKLFAFVQTNSAFQSSEEVTNPINHCSEDTGDLIPEKLNNQTREPDLGVLTRSKSHEISTELDENRLDWKEKKTLMGSRSFRAVEEFKASIAASSTERSKEHNRSSKDHSESSSYYVKTDARDPQNLEGSGSLRNWVKSEDTVRENGWRRKAIAERLQSLDVSTVEFPVIKGVKHLKHTQKQGHDQVAYFTPKFGNYNDFDEAIGEGDCDLRFEFCTELVTAFEDRVTKIQEEEEEIILRDIDNLVEEEVPSNVVN